MPFQGPYKGVKGFKGLKAGAGRGGPMRLSAATSSAARGAALLQSKVTVSSGRPPASCRSITTGSAHQHHEHFRTDLFGRPLLRLPTFRQSQATALTAEPLLLEEATDAASPADSGPVTDANVGESGSSALQTPGRLAEADVDLSLASTAIPAADGLSAADAVPAQSPSESVLPASAATVGSATEEEQQSASLAPVDTGREGEQRRPSAALADAGGLEQEQQHDIAAEWAATSGSEPQKQPAPPLSVQASSSGEPQPESPGTPAQSTESRAAVVGGDGRPTVERLRDPVMARFLVPQPVAGFLIGTGGARVRAYSERSGAKVWVAGQQLEDVQGMRTLYMQGSLEAVEEAVFMVFTDLTSAEAPKERRNFFRTKDGRAKARMLVPSWLAGTVLGKGARNITAANAETGAFMRFAPAADESERDRLLEIVAPDVSVLGRATTEVMKLFLGNPRYRAVFIAPGGVSSESLTARKRWHDQRQRGKVNRGNGTALRAARTAAQPEQ